MTEQLLTEIAKLKSDLAIAKEIERQLRLRLAFFVDTACAECRRKERKIR